MNKQAIVELNDVYKIYKQGDIEVMALRGVNLTIKPGELIVVMGPSGSGKTTLLNVISGMEKPTAGSVRVKGMEITRLKDEGIQALLRTEIGIIFQFFNLIPSLTAAGNIEMPMIITKTPKNDRKRRVKELLDVVGMGSRANHRPFTLSGGEKQRIAIAMAFSNNPTIILADEPTGNIDSVSSEKIMYIFQDFLEKNPEKAMILVTHDAALRKIAHRTLVIKDGLIVRELGPYNSEDNDALNQKNNQKLEDRIAFINNEHLLAKDILNENHKYPHYNDIVNCPVCKSEKIIKSYAKEKGNVELTDKQVLTSVSIYCEECREIIHKKVSLYDIKKDLV